MRLKIAVRNIFRNRGRTSVSVLMIAGAVASIIIFRGFSAELLHKLQKVSTESQYGHIQIATIPQWESTPGNRKGHYIHDLPKLREELKKNSSIISTSGGLSGYALISSGELTVSAKMVGVEPENAAALQSVMWLPENQQLNAGSKFEVLLGAGLARQMNVKVNDDVTALANTLDGVMNAVDLKVKGIFRTGLSEIDENVFFLPLSAAQTLLDTHDIDKLTLRIANVDKAEDVRAQIQPAISGLNETYKAKTWYEQADFYRRTEAFYKLQDRVITIILVSLILLGILNSVGMSIYERTGEIGTIRALGDSENSLIHQFLLEGSVLGFLGVAVGFILGPMLVILINSAGFTMDVPGASVPVPIEVQMIPEAFFEAAVVSVIAAILASYIPSVRASRISIVDALRENI